MVRERRRMPAVAAEPQPIPLARTPATPTSAARTPAAPTSAARTPAAPTTLTPTTAAQTTADPGSAVVPGAASPIDDLSRRTRLWVHADRGSPGVVLQAAGRPRRVATADGATADGATAPAVVSYRVRAGDTVGSICRRAGLDVGDVLAANRLGPDSVIQPDQLLLLAGLAPQRALPSAPRGRRPSPSLYSVRPGDTARSVAQRGGVTTAAVLAANGLTARSVLTPGRTLVVPAAGAVPRTATAARSEPPPATTFLRRPYPEAVVPAAAANRAALALREVPARALVRRLVASTARRYGVDPRWPWRSPTWSPASTSVGCPPPTPWARCR